MTPNKLLTISIIPGLAELVGLGIPDTPEARRFMLTIALQESHILHRRQVTDSGKEDGPAVSFWQFERGGSVKGVLNHPRSRPIILKVCDALNIAPTEQDVWEAMRYNDILAACMARLNFYVLPGALPKTQAEGWAQYTTAWRPGAPKPDTWPSYWAAADLITKGT